MAYIIGLKHMKGKARPSIGHFLWSNDHRRHAWLRKEYTEIGELAAAVNAATLFLTQHGDDFYQMDVAEVNAAAEIVVPPEPAPQGAENEPKPQGADAAPERPAGRRRLQPQLATA